MKRDAMRNETVETLAWFGRGRLVRTRGGQYRFEGGSRSDWLEALEWTAMFLPELVFTGGEQ